jgi:predicted MFS family arabinose efflux permease
MTGFICIATETLPAGLLPQIAADFGISTAFAGQLVTAYALGSLIAAIPLTLATSGWPRRNALMLTVVIFLVFNTVTALSTNLYLTLAARFFAGTAAGLAWSLIAGYARRMVAPYQQGRAIAVAMVGTPVALSIGVPLATWLGGVVGWRATFGVMSGLAVLLMAWIMLKVPNYPGQPANGKIPFGRVLALPGVRPVLAVAVSWMLAHNILYTFVAPYAALSGLDAHVDLVLLAFGVAALGGIWLAGALVDRALRSTVLGSLAGFFAATLMLGIFSNVAVIVLLAVAVWGITFGGAATLLQTALADNAGDAADVAMSANTVAWNTAIAGGGIVGGLLLEGMGVTSLPWVMLAIIAFAWAVTFITRVHGFRRGRRQHGGIVAGH